MTYIQFNALSISEKRKIVFEENAKFIASRKYYNYQISLFDCDEFFVEYWYFPEDESMEKIEGIPLDDKRVNLYIEQSLKAEK